MSFHRIRRLAGRPYPGRIELAALAALYGAYEIVRGFGGEDWAAARAHTADIVALERRLNLFVERDIQDFLNSIAGVPALLGFLYVLLHFAGTAAALIWVHRRRPHAFPFVRSTLIVSTALALVGWRAWSMLRAPELPVVAYSELLSAIDAGRVASITVGGRSQKG